MSRTEQDRAAGATSGFVRLGAAADRLGYSESTLRRWYRKRWLPLIRAGRGACVPLSFLAMLEASPRPGRAGVVAEVAAEWFRLYAGEVTA
jgi:hypothetical protein